MLKSVALIHFPDPTEFTPELNAQGEMFSWGIVEEDESVEQSLMERIAMLMIQGSAPLYHGRLRPQVIFIDKLIERKVSAIFTLSTAIF